jgi:hypothetical protein
VATTYLLKVTYCVCVPHSIGLEASRKQRRADRNARDPADDRDAAAASDGACGEQRSNGID